MNDLIVINLNALIHSRAVIWIKLKSIETAWSLHDGLWRWKGWSGFCWTVLIKPIVHLKWRFPFYPFISNLEPLIDKHFAIEVLLAWLTSYRAGVHLQSTQFLSMDESLKTRFVNSDDPHTYHTIIWICPSVCSFTIYSTVCGLHTMESRLGHSLLACHSGPITTKL